MAWKWLSLQQMRKYWVPIDICKPLMKEGHNDLNLKVKIDPVESAFQLNCFFKKLAIENANIANIAPDITISKI